MQAVDDSGGLFGGGCGSCCGSLLCYKQELQALDFLFSIDGGGLFGGDGGGLLVGVNGDGLLCVGPLEGSGTGGGLFGGGIGDGCAAMTSTV